MIAFFLNLDAVLTNPFSLLFAVFALWMFVDAIRREEWLWAVFILFFPPLNAPLYFFLVFRNAAPLSTLGFELPGAHDRRRIKELQAHIHHLDKAHHHLELGDIYFQQGKLPMALASYQRAYERDPEDADIRSHLGQCLLLLKQPQEAKALIAKVCAENSKHDYGHSLMALAEAQIASGEIDPAIATLQRVLEDHSYARARVQWAALLMTKGQADVARAQLNEVIADDANAPEFQRRRDRVWVKRAKKMLR